MGALFLKGGVSFGVFLCPPCGLVRFGADRAAVPSEAVQVPPSPTSVTWLKDEEQGETWSASKRTQSPRTVVASRVSSQSRMLSEEIDYCVRKEE